MASSGKAANDVSAYFDGHNGRYFVVADVVLDDGSYLRDVTFDTDLQVAVEVGRTPAADLPAHFGKRVVDLCDVRDEMKRKAFAARYRSNAECPA